MKIILTIVILASMCMSTLFGQAENSPAAPLELISTIPVYNITGRIAHIAYNSKSNLLYVAALSNNTLEVISLGDKKVIRSVKSLNQPQDVTFIPTTDMIFIACLGNGLCKGFDANSYLEAKTQNIGGSVNTVRYSSFFNQLFVGHGEGAITIYDANSIKIKTTIKLSARPESFQVDEKSNLMFINIPKSKKIDVVDLKTNTIKNSWSIEGAADNYPMALDTANHRLFIGCQNPAKLVIFNSESGERIASIDIDGDVNDIFFNYVNKQIYLSCGNGYVDVIKHDVKQVKKIIKQEPKPAAKPTKTTKGKTGAKQAKPVAKQETIMVNQDTYETISRIYTSTGARTSLFVPELNQLFVAVPASSGKDAQIMVYQVK